MASTPSGIELYLHVHFQFLIFDNQMVGGLCVILRTTDLLLVSDVGSRKFKIF